MTSGIGDSGDENNFTINQYEMFATVLENRYRLNLIKFVLKGSAMRSGLSPSVFLLSVCIIISPLLTLRFCAAQSKQLSNNNRTYLVFANIRYVEPIRERFQDPVPIADEPIQYYNGTEMPICAQIDPLADVEEVVGQEDCLFLNIYTHQTNGSAPVMLWIHGGAWNFGSGNEEYYGPGALMDEDIVLVTINYRLGPLGFGSLENSEMAGNYGLKDQAEAIKWVSRNIQKFGGDPKMITLFGQSVGAASVMYHLKGKLAGLIRGGIAQSGSTLSPWAIGPPGAVRRMTTRLAENAGCKRKTDKEIVECLRNLPTEDVVAASRRFTLIEQHLLPFRPVLEPQGIVTEDPWDSPPSDLPLMIGFTSSEAAFLAALLTKEGSFIIRFLNAAFDTLMPEVLMYEETAPNVKEVTALIKKFYLANETITMENIAPLIDMMSDAYIVFPTYAEAQRHNGTLYTYLFNHTGEVSIASIIGTPKELGVSHGDEVPYLFNTRKLDLRKVGNDNDKQKSVEIIKIWTNFAKGLDPLSDMAEKEDWNKLSKEGGYLEIDTDQYVFSKVDDVPNSWLEERLEFWSHLQYRL